MCAGRIEKKNGGRGEDNEDLDLIQSSEKGKEIKIFCRTIWQPMEIKKRESKVRWGMSNANVCEKYRWRDEAVSENALKWWQGSQAMSRVKDSELRSKV